MDTAVATVAPVAPRAPRITSAHVFALRAVAEMSLLPDVKSLAGKAWATAPRYTTVLCHRTGVTERMFAALLALGLATVERAEEGQPWELKVSSLGQQRLAALRAAALAKNVQYAQAQVAAARAELLRAEACLAEAERRQAADAAGGQS